MSASDETGGDSRMTALNSADLITDRTKEDICGNWNIFNSGGQLDLLLPVA